VTVTTPMGAGVSSKTTACPSIVITPGDTVTTTCGSP
jgi:hypothetical protein